MASQYMKVTVRGVGGGRAGARKPNAPRIVFQKPKIRIVSGKNKA